MLSALKDIISPDVILPITEQQNGQKFLIVKETANQSKIKKLTVEDLEEEGFAFSLDHEPARKSERQCFKQLSPYLNRANAYVNKGCDLVLFTQFHGQWYVLILDLKSNKPRIEKTADQLQNSELFARYICSLMQAYCDGKQPSLNFKQVYTTTRISKGHVYHGKADPSPCRAVSVNLNRHNEAKVHLGKLLGL